LKKLYLGSLFLVILFTYSCVSSSPRTYRGSLTDAMGKASNDYSGPRTVPSYENKQDDFNFDSKLWYNYPNTAPLNKKNDSKIYETNNRTYDLSPWFGFRTSKSLFSEPLDTPGYGELYYLGGEKKANFEIGFFVGAGVMETKPNSVLSKSIDPYLLLGKIGFDVRYNLFPELKFMSPYLIATGGGYFITWGFKNSLQGTDGVIITSDTLGGVSLGAGLGLDLVKTSRFRLGVAAVPEVYLMGQYTGNGFYNDYFPANGGINIGIEAIFSF
jgi:hypothetical protein